MKLGILALGRGTFDLDFADQNLAAMLAALDAQGHDLVGPRRLLLEEAETRAAMDELEAAAVDQVLILQVTFTDASLTCAISKRFAQPLSIWAIPEPRIGGRLRLNSFCGLNLASHALGLQERAFSWLYAAPDAAVQSQLTALLTGERLAKPIALGAVPPASDEGLALAEAVKGQRIARIGEHPAGFDTCAYDATALGDLAGVEVDALELDDMFDAAKAAPEATCRSLREVVAGQVQGLDEVNAEELARSLRLKLGLEALRAKGKYDAFAIRCWPETFTEYGGAVCGPAGMLGEARVPCACEADVYGALTQLFLSKAADAPVFLTDLVDVDGPDDTAVVWHCGQAPLSMRDPEVAAEATIHTNRKQPLLYQFTLRPGPVTLLRISQARNTPQMILGLADMQARPMSFTGTSGVLRFRRPADQVLSDIIDSGLEHHLALAYGDHRAVLRGLAGALNLPIVEL